ncbi:MAG: GTPase domain-containing protein [Candidatus Lokiarchaeota archaeon]|nr:GTPase domain-containing protein [Candidatus Lokiarchaeota archaeon]
MIINQLQKIINIKIVYFGPALSGKTTSLKSLFNHFGKKDQVKSIESSINRTLFFDYGVILFQNEQWQLKINIYSTTGQDFYIITRPTVLKGIDGIIFVADSNELSLKRNLISWNELGNYFNKKIFNEFPKIIAFNKQDLLNKFNVSEFLEDINYKIYDNIGLKYTIAINGEGILVTFEELLCMIFKKIYKYEFPLKLKN